MTEVSLWTLAISGASLFFVIFAVTSPLAAMRTAGEDRAPCLMIEYLVKNKEEKDRASVLR